MSKHTETPYNAQLVTSHYQKKYIIQDSVGNVIVSTPENYDGEKHKANADFIVRACNSHDDLVAACKEALLWIDMRTRTQCKSDTHNEILALLQQALAKAGE